MNGFHDWPKPPIALDQGRHAGRGKSGLAVHQGQVTTHTQEGAAPCARDRILGGPRVREHARARQNAAVVRVEDAVVDADGQAEIVGVD